MGWALPLWPHPQQLRASAAQQQPLRAPLWRLDGERSDHSEKDTYLAELVYIMLEDILRNKCLIVPNGCVQIIKNIPSGG